MRYRGIMKKLVFTFAVLIAAYQTTTAQVYFEEEEQDSLTFADRLYFGGNLSLNIFGTNKFIDVSPIVGYQIDNAWSVGGGLTYQYISREFTSIPSGDRFTVSSSVYGGRAFARYNVNETYFAYTEFENLNAEFGVGNGESQREWVPGFFIGGGTFQPVFGRGGINVMILYNLLHDELRSPYNSQWVFRAGVTL